MNIERKPSRTRIVTYRFEGLFNETAVEKILQTAKRWGVVTEYDTGRGAIVWFQGPPGARLREVRRMVAELIL